MVHITNYRVGFSTINTSNFGNVIPTSGVFEGTNRQNWFNNLLSSTVPTLGTPLKEALNRAGVYFSRTDNNGPYGPAPQLSCRRNFTILTTDGYYNDATIGGIGNEDNTAGLVITGPNSQSYQYTPASPYKDTYTNTLADISMYYWTKDLRTDLSNNLRTTSTNPSFWQNMNTFTLSLGPQGTLNPSTNLAALKSGSLSWPDPLAGTQQKIDDLWHTAVNGRGTFVGPRISPSLPTASFPTSIQSEKRAAHGISPSPLSCWRRTANPSSRVTPETGAAIYGLSATTPRVK